MRRTTPSNRIAGYYRETRAPLYSANPVTSSSSAWRPVAQPRRVTIAAVHRLGGPAAGILACLLQLVASTLCIAGGVSSWLGHPVSVSPTTMVLIGGAVLGASSCLMLYSFLVSAAVASASMQDAD